MTHPHLALRCHLSSVKLLYSKSLAPSVAFDLSALGAVISTVLRMASLSINKLSCCWIDVICPFVIMDDV